MGVLFAGQLVEQNMVEFSELRAVPDIRDKFGMLFSVQRLDNEIDRIKCELPTQNGDAEKRLHKQLEMLEEANRDPSAARYALLIELEKAAKKDLKSEEF